MQENVAGARVVKAYVKEEYEMVLNLCIVAVILVGGQTVKTGGSITPGNTMAAITYLSQILHGITFMANIFQTFTRAKASAARISEVMKNPDVILDGLLTEEPEPMGEVDFKHVSFSYPESAGESVLEDISFSVKQGETLAIIGATGCGKSSLVNLIPRFYDVTEGEVLVDGRNVKTTLRKICGIKSPSCCRKRSSIPAPSRPISAGVRMTQTPGRLRKRPRSHRRMISSVRQNTDITRW